MNELKDFHVCTHIVIYAHISQDIEKLHFLKWILVQIYLKQLHRKYFIHTVLIWRYKYTGIHLVNAQALYLHIIIILIRVF